MVILGLGTNVGDRLVYLQQAINSLAETVLNITAISPIYESPALLAPNALPQWNCNFLNMAIMGETHLSPEKLLLAVKNIEKKLGRQNRGIWAPREIDIDILAMDSLYLNQSNLHIPHISLCQRDFALLPFADIAPNWRYPAPGLYNGKTAFDIAFDINKSAVKTSYIIRLENKKAA